MTDLERKLEEIARLLTAKYGQEVGIRAGILSASEATARYCAEMVNKTTEAIAKAKNEEGNTEAGRALQKAVWATFTCEQAILKECGIKE